MLRILQSFAIVQSVDIAAVGLLLELYLSIHMMGYLDISLSP